MSGWFDGVETTEMNMADEMSKKAQNFLDELRDLCRRHSVSLAVSGYDSLQVWDLADRRDDPIHANGIDDRTTSNAPHEGRAAGFSAERPFDAVVGRHRE